MIEPDTNMIHVEGISGIIKTGKKNSTLTTSVQVLDTNGSPIAGAVVNAQITNPANGGAVSTLKARTGRTGVATFNSTSVTPSWQFCITNLSKTGYVYDSSVNKETCDIFSR